MCRGNLPGKTMRFVSDVLSARDAHDASLESGKGKEGETGHFGVDYEEGFKEFGKELPKTWEVVEQFEFSDATTLLTPIKGWQDGCGHWYSWSHGFLVCVIFLFRVICQVLRRRGLYSTCILSMR